MSTFGIVHRFPRGTHEQYEKTIEVVHPNGGKALPEGQLLHLAGPSRDGWLVMAVHESRESWERFRDHTLMPGLAGIDGAQISSRRRPVNVSSDEKGTLRQRVGSPTLPGLLRRCSVFGDGAGRGASHWLDGPASPSHQAIEATRCSHFLPNRTRPKRTGLGAGRFGRT